MGHIHARTHNEIKPMYCALNIRKYVYYVLWFYCAPIVKIILPGIGTGLMEYSRGVLGELIKWFTALTHSNYECLCNSK